MGIASLIAWVLTAGGGAFMLAKWVGGGGHRDSTRSALAPAAVFGHFGLAGLGLVLWIVYLVTDNHPIGWIALALLIPVVVLGFAMVRRWLSVYRGDAAGGQPSAVQDAPERSFPFPVVIGHGVLAVVTIVLALLAILEV
ncbi:hypothetical protein [Mycolicibacterium thermoresistibile]|jgi:hypothetical protein|uniref:Integral membrane protein n=2 Tax=Mycolicibacterium thermoresistibile TaxID=1797 RepID=G7CK51_MYCT3|nr:hypothetical protein [Mycolicibacterium thermoresistibile]EHI11642.1 hypothetical protein KEK_12123 [Mycolicibacterium thermoresistibile ATCC 19527]MCV7187724.1 hypothetical protein [Mycolicibacterium thermoresistibile]GAT13533.1 putative uncharacterized protein [Mycolicibacterium thermoresistibile]SNW17174.1 Uncharacterised protein [Mycolicibacterium thermoresistibile]